MASIASPACSATESFQQFLRIRTVSGEGPKSGAYAEAAAWLAALATRAGLSVEIIEPVVCKPVVVARWAGRDPSLPCLLLNSHYDVVPAMEEHWDHDPWAATLLENGRIVGRGTQDMKCVCVQYLLAVERLVASGFSPERDVVLTFVPDEEIGGKDGMGEFLKVGHATS